jgi:hypothetical protein
VVQERADEIWRQLAAMPDERLALNLPADPTDLPPEWIYDPTHQDPGGQRWRHPNGDDYLDFHKGRTGKPGWEGKDHWHRNGLPKHYKPGEEIPDPIPVSRFRRLFNRQYWERVTGLTGAALVAYLIISEGTRIIPARNLVPVP